VTALTALKTVDLRSDTVTQPTSAMRAAMAAAPLGDDVFGADPSVNALQEKIADMLGFEAALFVPTGTQSNLCAILSHCGRGDEYIVGQQAHAYRWEGGGAAVFGSVQPQPLDHAADGTLPISAIEAAIKPDDAHFARTRLLALENTLGGKLLPFDYVQAATDLAKAKGLQRHLDGARLFNAAVAQAARGGGDVRVEARRIAQCFDSVSVCFSKGLGAPIGSALCGSRELIASAHRPAFSLQRHRMRSTITSIGWPTITRWQSGLRQDWRVSTGSWSRRRRPIWFSSISPVLSKNARPSCWPR
jgi:threonine aldolase